MEKILQENIDITELSNFKTLAKTRYFFEINNINDINKLKQIIDFSRKENLKILFIGGGTNLLFAFNIYNGIIIKNNLKGWGYNKYSQILESYSAENISDIAEILFKDDRQFLWKRFIGLPGTIGGAIYGNAGCFGLEASNNFLEATVLNLDSLEIEIFNKKQMIFSYRNSILKENDGKYFLIKTKFDLSEKIEKYHSKVDNVYFRKHKQPKGNTCGSFFKNPNKNFSAGKLIEDIGFKGHKINGAYFSELHANFLMNDGTANYKDLLNLIVLVQKEVRQKYDLDLIPEVRIITNN